MKVCKICGKLITDTYNKRRNTHKDCDETFSYIPSKKGGSTYRK